MYKYNAKRDKKLLGKQRKPISKYIPKKVNDIIVLSTDYERFAYIIYVIQHSTHIKHRKSDKDYSFAPINKKKLTKILGVNVSTILPKLKDMGVIEFDEYIIGKKSRYYRKN